MPTYAVGQRLTAALLQELADLLGDSITSNSATADVGTFTTTETSLNTVTATLEAGKTYQIQTYCRIASSVAADLVILRIRLTNTSGTVIQAGQVSAATTSSVGFSNTLMTEYTASASGDVVFVLTGVRNSGTGNITSKGSATEPCWITVRLKAD